jgi:hypothetical protein
LWSCQWHGSRMGWFTCLDSNRRIFRCWAKYNRFRITHVRVGSAQLLQQCRLSSIRALFHSVTPSPSSHTVSTRFLMCIRVQMWRIWLTSFFSIIYLFLSCLNLNHRKLSHLFWFLRNHRL